MPLSIHLDLSGLEDLSLMPGRIKQALNEAARDLTSMAHAKAHELAEQRLHSRRRMFIDGLSVTQVSEGTWFLELNAKVRWIDDGMEPHDMIQQLLKSAKAKTSKDGSRYLVVPFKHGGSEGGSEPQVASVNAIKSEMKKRGIPWNRVERDESGRPKYGRVASFNVSNPPVKSGMGPGQGHGPVGSPHQGMSARNAAVNQGAGGFESSKSKGGGTGHLQGVSVYQRKGAGGKVEKDVVSFRVVSDKQSGGGRWQHPGLEPAGIFDAVHTWLSDTWERDIQPAVIAKIRG